MDKKEDGLPFLRQVIEVEKFKKGQANVIVAPCHSGKTTAAVHVMEKCASCKERTLFLIDTAAGRDSLVMKPEEEHEAEETPKIEAQRYTESWAYELRCNNLEHLRNGQGYRVMTYHQFGWEIIRHPDLLLNIDLIICDEMHNLLKYMGIEHGRNLSEDTEEEVRCCATAFSTLMSVAQAKAQAPLLIIMTATPNTLLQKMDEFKIPYELFNYTGRVHSDGTYVRRYYVSHESVLTGLKRNERAIVYIPTIHLMKEYASKVGDGRKTCCLWGKNNLEHELSEEQLKVRNEILTTKRIPADVDLLFINAAYETCINIENEDFNTMIIHCGNTDTQMQVRGRLRHDIDVLYLYDKKHEYISHYLPDRFFDRPLFQQDKMEIVEMLSLKDENGRIKKWPTICKLLEKDGVIVQRIKTNDKRGYVLHKAA